MRAADLDGDSPALVYQSGQSAVLCPDAAEAPRKKTTEGLYLTVEQIHVAVNACVQGQSLSPRDQKKLYQKTARIISYHQRHNRDGRLGHTKTMRVLLLYQGIEVDSLQTCVPHEFG